jgi:hypothetical protein
MRARARRVLRRPTPSIQHTLRPEQPLPIPGCRCDRCEDARDEAHHQQLGAMLGLDDTHTDDLSD